MIFKIQVVLPAVCIAKILDFYEHIFQRVNVDTVVCFILFPKSNNPCESAAQNVILAWKKYHGTIRQVGHMFSKIYVCYKTTQNQVKHMPDKTEDFN